MFFGELPKECPPADATDASGVECYRLVSPGGPTDADFVPLAVEFPARDFGSNACMSWGLSVFKTIPSCRLAAKMPRLRGKAVAKVIIQKNPGKIVETGRRDHLTWWRLSSHVPLRDCLIELVENEA